MIILIGTENCNRCTMTKDILNNRNINFTYKLLSDLSKDEQDNLLVLAKESNQTSFPLILKDNKIITLQEVN